MGFRVWYGTASFRRHVEAVEQQVEVGGVVVSCGRRPFAPRWHRSGVIALQCGLQGGFTTSVKMPVGIFKNAERAGVVLSKFQGVGRVDDGRFNGGLERRPFEPHQTGNVFIIALWRGVQGKVTANVQRPMKIFRNAERADVVSRQVQDVD